MDRSTPEPSGGSNHLALPNHGTTSVSRTRSRRQQFTDDEVKPLLVNLSPASTLDALTSTSVLPNSTDQRRQFIMASVENASESERAWGIRAALAGKKIREWLDELTAWPWACTQRGNSFEDEWERKQVEEYIQRIETIRDDMETLHVEDLKDHVRKAHNKPETGASDYEKLDDFTAVITATIVQSLPPLLHLDSLLNSWSIRLVIIRKRSIFLQEMQGCQESMTSAWMAIGRGEPGDNRSRTGFTRQTFREVQAVLQDLTAHLGQRIDGMLDLLEGSKDTLPELWIDGVDGLENEYSSWVAKGEELALNSEVGFSRNHDVAPMTGDQAANGAAAESQHRRVSPGGNVSEDVPQFDGASESRLAAPFDPAIPLHKYPSEASTSTSSDANSEISRPGSSISGPSSGRSSAEIMRASIATNPGSPMKVTTPIRKSFQSAQVQRFGSVKSKDIRRLLVRRSDSCPSAIPLANEPDRRQSVGGTSLASHHAEADSADQVVETAQTGADAKEEMMQPLKDRESYFPDTTPFLGKPRSRLEQYEDFPPGSAPIKVQKQRSSKPLAPSPHLDTPILASPSKHKDKLEARISSILHHIPADIRLKSSGAKTPPPPLALSRPKTPLRRSITPKLLRTKTPTPATSPSLTLAPATDPGPKSLNRSIHEPEIKLYHLQQTNLGGKDATPVKLYVRLVGADGERVMVRVGGGWADLGEYLKEYALHHGATSGKRTVSDFQIQNLPTPGSASTGLPTPRSRPASRPGSRSSWLGNDETPSPSPAGIGLAGRTGRDAEIDGERQAMVDEVVAQANGVGKMGGIRRVFLKRRSTLGEKD